MLRNGDEITFPGRRIDLGQILFRLQGARRANSRAIEPTSNAAVRDGSAHQNRKLFLSEL
jgi:hypothetical protein